MAAPNARMDHGATLRLVLTYAAFASLWILLSDQAVLWLFRDPDQIAFVSSLKGWLFVGVTSVLLYGLIQRNLTQVRHTLERLSASEEHLRVLNQALESNVAQRSQELLDLYNQAPCGYHSLAPDGTVLRANQTELALLGYARDEFVGHPLHTFMTPESAARYQRGMQALEHSGRLRDLECELVCKHGQVQPFLLSADLLRDASGQVSGIRGTLVDNSERRTQTQRILDLNKFLNDVLAVLPFGVVVLNQDREVILRNTLFGKLLDYPAALAGREPLLFTDLLRFNHARGDYPEQSLSEVLAHFDALYQSRQISRLERSQASGIYLEICVQPISADWTLITFTDVTAHKAAEKSLEAARQVAEAATVAKSDFLANMSHEIRTPMNGILGLAYLLERSNLAPEAARLAHKISHTGKTLQGILNDILDFSKIEAGQLVLEQTSFHLSDVLETVATIMVTDPSQKEIELAIAPPPVNLPALQGDPLRIGQVLINLVGNAIKFTHSGHVALDVTRQDPSDAGTSLRFTVSDTGIGISKAKLDEIFKPFSQADASTTRRFGGTGLGLAISRRLVELMGSQLHVQSTEGQGSSFWFTLELPWTPSPESIGPRIRDLDVLIADDSAISRDALRATTLALGWQASVVDSGQAAVQHVLERQQRHGAPQVLLLDWQMPDLDGLAVVRRVNAALRGQQGPVLILATAFSRDDLLAQPDSDLVDAVLSKPVSPSALYDAVAAALDKRLGNSLPGASAQRQRLDGIHLLVVDDNDVNLEIALLIFEAEGAQVSTATNGQEALDWLQAHPDTIDLVLMDVQMPVMDGVQATRQMRALPALSQLPVVALTAGAFKANREEALAAGMNEHLSKPMDVEQAVAIILRLTGHAQWANSRSAVSISPWQDAEHDLPGLRVTRGLAIWRDAAVYQQYLRKFARDYGHCVSAIEQGTLANMQSQAHKLRGAAGNLALDLVAAAAAELDDLLKCRGQGETPADAAATAAALQTLREAIALACASIASYAGAAPDSAAGPAANGDQTRLAQLLQTALHELARDTPDGVEPVLQALETRLGQNQTAALRHALENFDFRAGEVAVRELAETLHMPLEAAA